MSASAWARSLAVTALLAGAVLGLSACGGDDGASPAPTAATAAASDGLSAIPQDLADGFALGKKDAPLTLVVYEDFQCPFCLRYTTAFESMLVEDYVKPGKLRIEFRRLLDGFREIRVVPERFPVTSRLHGGWKGAVYNGLFVGTFNALPKPLVRRFGWHLLAFCEK